MRSPRLCALVCFALVFIGPVVHAGHTAPARVVVLGVELVAGDLSGAAAATPEEKERREKTAQLMRELLATNGYAVVDRVGTEEAVANAEINEFMHMCNGCELDLGRSVSADWVLVAWVQRVSNLILNLNVVVRRVNDGETIAQAFVDMRGNTDKAWLRAARYAFDNSLLGQLEANR